MSEEPSPVLYLDRALGRHTVAVALRAAGLTVEIHDDHFPQDAKDVDWLPAVAAKGWVVLTKDAAVARRPMERDAVETAGARVFAFSNANVPASAVAAGFLVAWPKMLALIDGSAGPFIAVVHRDGRVEVRFP